MSKRGFERKGGSKGGFDYADTFAREVLVAKKKAGRVVGREVVKERIEGLKDVHAKRIGGGVRTAASRNTYYRSLSGSGALSRRRRKAVRYVVGRDGTLVVLDHAPMAVMQETGGIIRAKDKLLKIQDRRRRARGGGNDVFVTKKGLVFEKKRYTRRRRNKNGKIVGPRPKQAQPRLVAVLKKQVAIPQLPERVRLTSISEHHLKRHADLFFEYLINGVK